MAWFNQLVIIIIIVSTCGGLQGSCSKHHSENSMSQSPACRASHLQVVPVCLSVCLSACSSACLSTSECRHIKCKSPLQTPSGHCCRVMQVQQATVAQV